MLLSDEEKALAVAREMERTKDNPDLMIDYSDIIAKAQRDLTDKEWVEWGDEDCPHGIQYRTKRRRCFKCWQARLKEIE